MGVGVGVGVGVVDTGVGLVGMAALLLVVGYTGIDNVGGPSNRGLFTRRLADTPATPTPVPVPVPAVGVDVARTNPGPLAPALRSGVA